MREGNIKILGIILVLSVSQIQSKDEKVETAKRALLLREKEYLKRQPLSQELKSFIRRFQKESSRSKRSSGIDTNLMYVMQDGQLVPFKSLEAKKNSEGEEPGGYTVVPLVIPRGAKTKLLKTRTLEEEFSNDVPNLDPMPTSVPEVTDFNPDDEGNSTQEETEVLNKILVDVESLMRTKHEGNSHEGVLCNMNGSWVSDAAGMRFDLVYHTSTRKKFKITVFDRVPQKDDGFMCDGNWSVFGEIPFLHSGLVIVLAVHTRDKNIAFFIGECRVCEGSESVSGTWLIGRPSRDCKDQKESFKIASDVWKREQGHILRKKHLLKIGRNVSDEED